MDFDYFVTKQETIHLNTSFFKNDKCNRELLAVAEGQIIRVSGIFRRRGYNNSILIENAVTCVNGIAINIGHIWAQDCYDLNITKDSLIIIQGIVSSYKCNDPLYNYDRSYGINSTRVIDIANY